MTSKQRKTELAETRALIERHKLEREQIGAIETKARYELEKRLETQKRALESEQVRQSIELRVKYGHEIGRGADALLEEGRQLGQGRVP
jgi:transcriptional regulator